MRILHVDYQQLRRYGKTRVSWAEKLAFGLIKNDHLLRSFSDRDVAAFEAPFGIRELGKGKANLRFLETFEATDPELLIIGHCDIITNETLKKVRQLKPSITIAYCNNDPLFVPENVEKIHHRCELADAVFVSTGRRELTPFEKHSCRLYHMPNPVDAAIECADNSLKTEFEHDLIFCSNSENHTTRMRTVEYLKHHLDESVRFATFGLFGQPPVWGRAYDRELEASKMGLNLNRQNGHYWYASARMAQLGGNGLLTITHSSHRFDELFPAESIVYFEDDESLCRTIEAFNHDDAMRQYWAANTRRFFHQEMNSKLYAQYIVEAATLSPFSHDYVWARDIQPDGTPS